MTHIALDTLEPFRVPDMRVSKATASLHVSLAQEPNASFGCDDIQQVGDGDTLTFNGFLQARTRHVEACVAKVFNIRHESLRASTRGKARVARARQVAMYVCHTTLGYSLTTVGDLFERDRTTVGHACRLVEDLRDEVGFDAMIICLERAVLAGCLASVLHGKISARGIAYV